MADTDLPVARPMARSITFHQEVVLPDDLSEDEAPPPPRRAVLRVESMRTRSKSHEGAVSRTDSPAKLYATINPQYTYLKACELYGGAPRPLYARHEFIRKAFLCDTEDWRSNAHVGNAKSPIAQMNITDPSACTYLSDAASRKMSYYRQKSLARAISYRATIIKRNGDLADTQYTDQYLDKETVMKSLKKQYSCASRSPPPSPSAENTAHVLSKSLSRAPDRVLTTQLSRMAPPGSPGSPSIKTPQVADKGMARAVSRIMTRTRTAKLASSGGLADQDSESEEEAPRMDDI